MSHRPRLSLHGLSLYVSKDERTKKNSSEAYLGLPTDDPAFEPCFGSVADVAWDVWGALNSRTPPFGSPVGHTDCPPGGASVQATLEVIAGLLELIRSQTSRSDISRYQRMRHEHMVCNIFFSKRQDFRPPKLYNPRIHIGERY